MNYLLAFIGGGIGACGRYWLSAFVYRFVEPVFPYGNLCVNVSGSFLIGFVMAFFEDRFTIMPGLRVFMTIGILGGYTTFSSFSYETVMLIRNGELFFAALNVILSIFLCLLGTYGGLWLGKLV